MAVRFFRRDEQEALLEAVGRIWRKDHIYIRNPAVMEHFLWESPRRAQFAGEGNYSAMGIWEDGKVRGFLCVTPQWLNVFGKKYQSVAAPLWAVEKEPKGTANGLDLLDCLFDRSPDMYMPLQMTDYAFPITKMLGWYTFEDFPRWVAVSPGEDGIDEILQDRSAKALLPVLSERRKACPEFHVSQGYDAEAWDKFYAERFAPRMIGTSRDSEFLKWRYEASPVLKYEFFSVCDSAGGCHGISVIRIEPILGGKYRIGRILEFIAVEAGASISLANGIVDSHRDILMWDFYCLSCITAFGLESIGFRRMPEWLEKAIVPALFQPIDWERMKINGAIYLSDEIKQRINPVRTDQWYFTKGDDSIDQPR